MAFVSSCRGYLQSESLTRNPGSVLKVGHSHDRLRMAVRQNEVVHNWPVEHQSMHWQSCLGRSLSE